MRGPLIKSDDFLADLLNAVFLRSSYRNNGRDNEEPSGNVATPPVEGAGVEPGSGDYDNPEGPDHSEITPEEAALRVAAKLLQEAHDRHAEKMRALKAMAPKIKLLK